MYSLLSHTVDKIKGSSLFKDLSWTLIAQTLGNLLRFLLIFVVVRCYTKEEFGLWASITSIAAIIVTGDFGLTNVLRNIASEGITKGAEGEKRTRESWFSAIVFLTFFAVAGIIILLFLSQFSFFESLFKTDDEALRALGKTVILVVLAIFLMNLPFSLASGMLLSYNEVKEYSIFGITGASLTFLVVVAQSLLHVRIDIVSISYFSCSLLVSIVTTLFFLHRRRWSIPRIPIKTVYLNMKAMLPSGVGFLGIGISSSFISNVLTIYSGSMLGLSVAASINVAQKIFSLFCSIIISLFNPIWAKLSRMYYGSEFKRCISLLQKSLFGTVMTAMLVVTAVSILRGPLVMIVAGSGYEVDVLAFILVGACLFAKVIFDNASLLLVATSQLKLVFWGYLFFSAIVLFIYPSIVSAIGFNWMMVTLIGCWSAFILIVYTYSVKLLRHGII